MLWDSHDSDPDGDLVLILNVDPDSSDEEDESDEDSGATDSTLVDKQEATSNAVVVCKSQPIPREFHVRVSSKHLTLASSFFRALLNRPFRERLALQDTGHLKLPLDDKDYEAMVILMDIVHGRLHQVPREVDEFLLAGIAILVDKYALHEALDFIAEKWIKAAPRTFSKYHTVWICISWVFEREGDFKSVTRMAQLERDSPIPDAEMEIYPIPDKVISQCFLASLHLSALTGCRTN
jgi:hypothetical protein